MCGAAVQLQFWDLAGTESPPRVLPACYVLFGTDTDAMLVPGQGCYLAGHALLLSERVIPVYVLVRPICTAVAPVLLSELRCSTSYA